MKKLKYSFLYLLFLMSISCGKYLDVVPDDIATIENAFSMRTNAEKFLFTCYAYMPSHASLSGNPAFTAGDEFWLHNDYVTSGWNIARGSQNVNDPYINYWQGSRDGKDLYQGIRDCNIFLENIDKVPDIQDYERSRWIAEVKFLKAYYHFWLVRMYGPIPLKKVNLPVYAGVEEVKVWRDPVDSCFNYIDQLLTEAAADLPARVQFEASELGRITKTIALAVKAQILVTAASPLFNGNQDYAGFKDNRGVILFNPTFEQSKWEKAKKACQEAVETAEEANYKLYYYNQSGQQYNVSDTTKKQMNIRNSINEKWNAEIIWGNTNSMANTIQVQATPRGLDPLKIANSGVNGNLAVPLKIVEVFYSNNGVPIDEDKTWNYANKFKLKTAQSKDRYYIENGYTTATINFDREPRFYASLGFDGGKWYGQGRFDDKDTWFVAAKKGQAASSVAFNSKNITGYWPKKLVNYNNIIGEGNTYTRQQYPWPVIRLADLYLLYAEALNETTAPGPDIYKWIDIVRQRAGLDNVVNSWNNYSVNPTKPETREGLREIIRRERLIELAFEGQRFWDLRRWKQSIIEQNKAISGWDTEQPTSEGYYREHFIFQQVFTTRDYFWPIKENEILANKNTVQNLGW